LIPGEVLAFAGVAAGLVMAPGVDFAAVARNALADRRAGVWTGVGVAAGSLVHTAVAVAGVATVLVAHRSLFAALQVAGGLYLLYLGIRSLLALRSAERAGASLRAEDEQPADGAPPQRISPPPRAARRPGAAFRQGFLVNVTNPKAPVLFLSLLPQFVPPGGDPLAWSLLLSAIVVAFVLVWFPAIAVAVHSVGALLGGRRVQRGLTLATALLLIGLGVRMLVAG
jgi:threonine/homoserine/homoserine lactone efflux protein